MFELDQSNPDVDRLRKYIKTDFYRPNNLSIYNILSLKFVTTKWLKYVCEDRYGLYYFNDDNNDSFSISIYKINSTVFYSVKDMKYKKYETSILSQQAIENAGRKIGFPLIGITIGDLITIHYHLNKYRRMSEIKGYERLYKRCRKCYDNSDDLTSSKFKLNIIAQFDHKGIISAVPESNNKHLSMSDFFRSMIVIDSWNGFSFTNTYYLLYIPSYPL